MALDAYLALRGSRQGDILGSVTLAGQAGKIRVIGVEHGLRSPRDASSGQATGKRIHGPIKITKELDRATPRLLSALATNEAIVAWELQFMRAGAGGQAENHYTIKLSNAFVSAAELTMPNNGDPALAARESYEVVSFTYHQIQWIWTDGSIIAQDVWSDASA